MSKTTLYSALFHQRLVRGTLSVLTAAALSCALLPMAAFADSGQLPPGTTLQSGVTRASALTPQASSKVKSAKKTTKKAAAFVIEKYGGTKRYAHATGKWAYGKPVIKGNSKAAKKINKSLDKRYAEYQKNLGRFLEYAASETRAMDMVNTYATKATYNSKGYVSFRYEWDWFAGGVSNGGYYGDVYSLKTGKKLNVSQMVAGNATKVKKKIVDAIEKQLKLDVYSSVYDRIMSKKISDFEFYLKGGKVVVVIDPYTWPGQHSALTVKLKGNYA